MSSPVYRLALHTPHVEAGARFAVASGWLLPSDYGDTRSEHQALRTAAALFDRSDRSRFLVTGPDAANVVAAAFADHAGELEEGRALRTAALDAGGCISDLVLVARLGAISYLVVGEPGRRLQTLASLEEAIRPGFEASVSDRTEKTCLLGLAGPAAEEQIRTAVAEALPSRLLPMQCLSFEFHGFRATAIRTSDTGEDGFEFMLAPAVAAHMLETLRTAGLALAGRAALEVARVEACIPAFAPDLEAGLTPGEAELDLLLGIPAGETPRTLAALLLDLQEPVPPGTPVTIGGEAIGEIRSCARSFTLDATIALAVIDRRNATPGAALEVAGNRASPVAKPFFRRRREA